MFYDAIIRIYNLLRYNHDYSYLQGLFPNRLIYKDFPNRLIYKKYSLTDSKISEIGLICPYPFLILFHVSFILLLTFIIRVISQQNNRIIKQIILVYLLLSTPFLRFRVSAELLSCVESNWDNILIIYFVP